MKSDWTVCTIGDLGKIITGKTPSTKNKLFWGGEIPFITPGDIQGGKHIIRTERCVTADGADSVKGALLPQNSICVSCIGNIGYVGMTTQVSISNQQINSIVVKNGVDHDYVYYLIKSLWKFFKNYEGQSTALSILNKTQFSKINIHLPQLGIQKKISLILSSIDKKIEVNEGINKNLEQQAQTIFDYSFPNITNGTNCIGDMITPKRGKSFLSKNAVPGDVPVIAGGIEPSTYHNTANTQAPVISISASGANAGYVNLWHIPVWSSDSSYIDSTMTNDVFFWYVLLKKRQKEIFDAQTGSAQPHIYPQHIANMPLGNVTQDDISKYTEIVKPLFAAIGTNKNENFHLAGIRDILLPKLMSGELDISDLNI